MLALHHVFYTETGELAGDVRRNSARFDRGQHLLRRRRGGPGPPISRSLSDIAELGGDEALKALKEISRDSDVELVRESIRALSQWPDATPVEHLFDLAGGQNDGTARTLALRGAISLSGRDPDTTRKLALLQKALELAERTEEKSLALSQLAQIAQGEALDLALPHLDGYANDNKIRSHKKRLISSLRDN